MQDLHPSNDNLIDELNRLHRLVQERTREVEEAVCQRLELLESISDCFYSLDEELRFTYVNKGAQNAAGLLWDEFIGKKIEEVFPGKIDTSLEKLRQVLKEKIPQHYELYSKVTQSWVYISVYPNHEGISVFWHDLTELKNAQFKLRRSQQDIADILASIKDPFFTLDGEWNFSYVNQAAREQFSNFGDLVGENIWHLFPKLVGSIYWDKYHEAMDSKRPQSFEAITKYSGFWSQVNVYPLANGISVLFRDITERKRIDEKIARLDRLNLIGEMAGSIGHEIRNPMTSVRGFLQVLGSKPAYQEDRDFFELMIEELDRANDIITEYLGMAKDRRVDLQAHSLDAIITALYPMLMSDANLRGTNIDLELSNPPQILVDESEIRQLIINIARNGMEAMAENGTLTIGTKFTSDEIVLYIRDEGSGLPPEIMKKLGTPFLTTKDKGTGLGLAVCYSIAARHNARIDCETGASGTIFYVRFPVSS